MTAIVGTINRRGIAFAADSAATLSISDKSKITNHTNKIFALSKKRPVGIAIYNNLDFHGVPWENIFKMYRDNHLGDGSFGSLKEYISDFWGYVTNTILPKLLTSQKSQVAYMVSRLKDEVIDIAKKQLEGSGSEINSSNLFPIMVSTLKAFIDDYKKHERAEGYEDYGLERFREYSKGIIEEQIKDILSDSLCPKDFYDLFSESIFWIMMSKREVYLSYTGLVFWGYGEDELFPSYFHYHVGMAFDERMKHIELSSYVVDNEHAACVEPFAQTDVANTVVRGIDQKLRDTLPEELHKSFETFRSTIVEELRKASAPSELTDVLEAINIDKHVQPFIDDMDGFIRENYTDKLLGTIALLNKEDMADMAESLVRMTCLKRHITTDEETVGGPVDVAVITKGDGFIWIKRKHYFSPELNQDFFKRK